MMYFNDVFRFHQLTNSQQKMFKNMYQKISSFVFKEADEKKEIPVTFTIHWLKHSLNANSESFKRVLNSSLLLIKLLFQCIQHLILVTNNVTTRYVFSQHKTHIYVIRKTWKLVIFHAQMHLQSPYYTGTRLAMKIIFQKYLFFSSSSTY